MNDWDPGEERLGSTGPFGRNHLPGSRGRHRQLLVLLGLLLLVGYLALGLISPSVQQPTVSAAAQSGTPTQSTLDAELGFLGTYQEPKSERTTLDPPNLLDILAKLLVVLALAWLAAGAMKRFLGGATGSRGRGLIRLVESSYLGPRRSLHLIKVADRTFLVGVTDQQVTLLSRWTGATFGAEPGEGTSGLESSPATFSHHLTSSLRSSDFLVPSQAVSRARACLAQLRTGVEAPDGAGHAGDRP